MLVYVCARQKKRVSCSSFCPNKALSCSHGLLSGCPEVPLWLQGSCFVVVNWAVPGRAGVILGKAYFPPLFHSLRCSLSLFSSSVLISQISPESKRCGVYCSSEKKDSAALSSYPPCLWVSCLCAYVCVSIPSALQIILVSTQ